MGIRVVQSGLNFKPEMTSGTNDMLTGSSLIRQRAFAPLFRDLSSGGEPSESCLSLSGVVPQNGRSDMSKRFSNESLRATWSYARSSGG